MTQIVSCVKIESDLRAGGSAPGGTSAIESGVGSRPTAESFLAYRGFAPRYRLSRTELTAATALSPSTVSAISADLMQEGVLIEQPEFGTIGTGAEGRRLLSRSTPTKHMWFPLNSLTTSSQLVSATIPARQSMSLMTGFPRLPVREKNCCSAARGLSAWRFQTLGIPGGINRHGCARPYRCGRPRSSLVANCSRTQCPFVRLPDSEFGCPVKVANDCSMIAVALRWLEPERYGRDCLAVLLSHGIGMGLYLNGQLFAGRSSSAAEFGHMLYKHNGALCRCGSRGCIEAYAGDYAIWRSAHGLQEDALPRLIFQVSTCAHLRKRPGQPMGRSARIP